MQRFRVIYIRRRGPYFAPPLSHSFPRNQIVPRNRSENSYLTRAIYASDSFPGKSNVFRSFEKKKEKKKRRMNFKRISFSISKDPSRFRMYGICGRSRFEIFYPSALSRLLSFRAHLVSIRDSGGAGGGLVSTLCSLANGCIQAY